jgi:broad specificity phosphatase PhoE
MGRLFVVRHGQASFLEKNYDQLSTIGEKQAIMLGDYWVQQEMTFQRVYSGPRKRQIETARIVGESYTRAGLPWPEIEVMREFDEYDGEWVMESGVAGLTDDNPDLHALHEAFTRASSVEEKHKSFQRLFEHVITRWVAGEIKVENVEPWPEFSRRVHHGLSHICATAGSGRNVALFSSGGPVGVTMQRALDLSSEHTLRVAWMVRNCAYSEFLFSGDRFTLSSFNSFPHLQAPSLLTYR